MARIYQTRDNPETRQQAQNHQPGLERTGELGYHTGDYGSGGESQTGKGDHQRSDYRYFSRTYTGKLEG